MNLSASAPHILATPIHMTSKHSMRDDRKHDLDTEADELSSGRVIHGDLPPKKRPKFVIVNDTQRGDHVRVRVKANIDCVNVDDIPDTVLTSSAVFPRSCQSQQMRCPPASLLRQAAFDDDEEEDEVRSEQRGRTLVPATMLDGRETHLPVPKLTRARRHKEVLLNQLGYRMTWCQVRTFNGRKLFLQHSCE